MTVPIQNRTKQIPRRFCIAPMMNHTDRHFRYFLRLLSPHAWLFTEMIPAQALRHGQAQALLAFDPQEHPIALQLGSSEPSDLALCASQAEAAGYDEINLNVGCPSSRVQAGRFGACLMKEPQRVAECITAMCDRVDIPVTVKCRIGVDDQDTDEEFFEFVQTLSQAGCSIFYVHARKGLLSGLSPRQNRSIPPLNYPRVWRLKQAFPRLTIVINGGIRTLEEVRQQLEQVDGVMLGRIACDDHQVLRAVEQELFPVEQDSPTSLEVLENYLPYLETQHRQGVPLALMTRHLTGLFRGQPGARKWRQQAARPDTFSSLQKTARQVASQ